jgi:hypothetical protein
VVLASKPSNTGTNKKKRKKEIPHFWTSTPVKIMPHQKREKN